MVVVLVYVVLVVAVVMVVVVCSGRYHCKRSYQITKTESREKGKRTMAELIAATTLEN